MKIEDPFQVDSAEWQRSSIINTSSWIDISTENGAF